ncbi:unnamed protein product [Caenorhabditis angaria]|uniref:Telomere length regulation protein conserved domain-containing protein n=1 Tax=Caenorhabditis angaria TaxID=860376 RepID=A0A9P1IIG9_9PELO|nr:unnamed protein product [Caenorhabditis angaria]
MFKRIRECSERAVFISLIDEPANNFEIDDFLQNFDVIHKFLTKNEVQVKVTNVILKMEPIETIRKLSEGFKNHQEEFIILIYWLEKLLEIHLAKIFEESLDIEPDDENSQQKLNEFIKSLIFLPDRVSNCGTKAKNKEEMDIVRNCLLEIENNFCDSITRSLSLAHSKLGKSDLINLKTIAEFVSKGMNLKIKNSKLSYFIFEWITEQNKNDVKWDRVAQRLFKDQTFGGAREYETLIIDIIINSKSVDQLKRCFGTGRNPIIDRILTVKMLFQRVISPLILRNIIDFYEKDTLTLRRILEYSIKIWTSFEFVRNSTLEKQRHISRLILYIIYILKKQNIKESIWQKVFYAISEGIQIRLSNSEMEIRQTAMFIGEIVSELNIEEMKKDGKEVDENARLKFEYEENEWVNEMKSIRESGISISIEPPTISAPQFHSHILQKPESLPIPDLNLDSDDEEDFPIFEVPESEKNFERLQKNQEPLKKFEPPKYIMDAFEMLLEKEKYEKFEAALNSIESLVRKNAIGFNQISDNLVRRLVFLDDIFSTPNFEEIQKRSIISCFVIKPHCVLSIIDLFLNNSSTMSHRYLILECIRNASKELSQPKELIKEKKKIEKENEENSWKNVVEARIRKNTKIFERAKDVKLVENRLGKCVNLFFYPLFVQSTGEHLQLQGRDTNLLSKLIYTITEVYLNAGLCPSISKMSQSLIQYVTPARFSEDPHIRISVLFAFCAVVETLSFEHIQSIFEKSQIEDWATWASQIANNQDSHEHERKLAECLINQIWKKINT